MGYTHYWTQIRDFTPIEWNDVHVHVAAILSTAQGPYAIDLADREGARGTRPEFDAETILFNGVGDDSHETFALYRERPPQESWQPERGRDFCKTARKPYDVVVTAVLCYLATIAGTHHVQSDGSGRDFLQGLELARRALPAFDNQLDIPMGIMQGDRWCGPWLNIFTDAYTFRFCVDGHAYVEQRDEPSHGYRFLDHAEALHFVERHGDLFDATGFFDEHRRQTLQHRQNDVLRKLIEEASAAPPCEGRREPPPAFIRPGQLFASAPG